MRGKLKRLSSIRNPFYHARVGFEKYFPMKWRWLKTQDVRDITTSWQKVVIKDYNRQTALSFLEKSALVPSS